MAINNITEANLQETLCDCRYVVLDFWATWCGPCKFISPKLEKLSEEHTEILFGKINVEEEQKLIKEYGITSIPTVIAVCDQKEVARHIGKASEEELREFLRSSFSSVFKEME